MIAENTVCEYVACVFACACVCVCVCVCVYVSVTFVIRKYLYYAYIIYLHVELYFMRFVFRKITRLSRVWLHCFLNTKCSFVCIRLTLQLYLSVSYLWFYLSFFKLYEYNDLFLLKK